jgi:hypothetical protein
MAKAKYNDRQYRARADALKRKTRREGLVCWICRKPFDWTVTDYRDPRAWTADHVEPLAQGGALLGELRPAHRACNSRRGDGTRQRKQLKPIRKTRDW